MCISPDLDRDSKTLTLSSFKRIIGQFPYLQKVSLVGAGEPLLNPELFDIIQYAKTKKLTVGFATNATLLTEATSRNIVSSGLDWLNISLDGASKEIYEKIRKGANFERVIRNIKKLIEIKEDKKPDVSVWFLALSGNISELPRLVQLVEELGLRSLYVQTAHFWCNSIWQEKVANMAIAADSALLKENLRIATDIAKEKGIAFEYVNIPDKATSRACKWPWKFPYITTDGYVTPCCLHGTDPKRINFGNLLNDDFMNIWNSAKYRDFRNKLKSDKAPTLCSGCPSYYCRMKI